MRGKRKNTALLSHVIVHALKKEECEKRTAYTLDREHEVNGMWTRAIVGAKNKEKIEVCSFHH